MDLPAYIFVIYKDLFADLHVQSLCILIQVRGM